MKNVKDKGGDKNGMSKGGNDIGDAKVGDGTIKKTDEMRDDTTGTVSHEHPYPGGLGNPNP